MVEIYLQEFFNTCLEEHHAHGTLSHLMKSNTNVYNFIHAVYASFSHDSEIVDRATPDDCKVICELCGFLAKNNSLEARNMTEPQLAKISIGPKMNRTSTSKGRRSMSLKIQRTER